MREGHRLCHLQQQCDASAQVERMPLAIHVDRLALDVFERHVRATKFVDAGIVKARDVRVFERREDRPFARETLREAWRPAQMRQLQRHLAIEQTVRALGQPHRPHAAGAKLADQPVGADHCAGCRLGGVPRCLGQQTQRRRGEIAGLGLGMARQQFAQRAGQRARVVGQRGQPARVLGR